MKLLWSYLCLPLFCHALLNVPNVVQYRWETAVPERLPDGVAVYRWAPPEPENSVDDFVLSPPHALSISVPVGKVFPVDGQAYWLERQTAYVVVKGEASIGNETGLAPGDLFYAGAGVAHGPITSTGSEDLLVSVATTSKFEMHTGPPPTMLPANLMQSMSGVGAHRGNSTQWRTDPTVPASEQCTANGGVKGAVFMQHEMIPGAMMVRFGKDCLVPYHYHPDGVLYFFVKGQIAVTGDFGPSNSTFGPGELRWARAGFSYGPEYTLEETLITVLGAPPMMVYNEKPSGSVLVVRKNVTLQISYANEQLPGPPASLPQAETPRTRRRLRRRAVLGNEGDEAAALQLGTEFADRWNGDLRDSAEDGGEEL